jgi:hypothetical protein
MEVFSMWKARRQWRKETKDSLAEVEVISRESVAGLRELQSLRVRLDRLFVRWQLADLDGDESASTKVVIQIGVLQDRRDLLLKREDELQFAIAKLQKHIHDKTWAVRQSMVGASPSRGHPSFQQQLGVAPAGRRLRCLAPKGVSWLV